MQKIQNVLMKYLMPIANKLEQQKHIQAIKDGIVASIPIIIIGSFCTIFLGIANLLGSGPVYDFLNANMGVLTYASAFTNDMLAVYATYFIAKTLSEKYDLKGSQPAVTALVVFFILCAVVKDGQLNTSYLGSTGLFTGIVAALFTVEIYHLCYERKWYIKMPESVPPMVQDSFAALVPLVLNTIIAVAIANLSLTFGKVAFPQLIMNVLAPAVTGSGLTLGLNILMMRSKAKSLSSVGKVSIIPGLFGINEPLIFGTPIILNPFMFIPFVFGPLICTTIVYLTMNLGLVGKPIANPPGFLPPGVSAFLMTLDWKSVVLVFVLLILQTVFYYPFFKMMEKEELQKEQALEK